MLTGGSSWVVNLVVVRGGWVGQEGWWQEVVVGGVKEVVGWGKRSSGLGS